MIRTLALVGALALASCAPAPVTDETPGATQTLTAAECTARGGQMRPVGRMQSVRCVLRYADAGKRCTDGDQCQGDCRVEGNSGLTPGAAVTGVCQATSDRFGCHTPVEDGKAGATLCID